MSNPHPELRIILLLSALLLGLLGTSASVRGEEQTSSLTINRLVVCSGLTNLKPLDQRSSFPPGAAKAYLFLEAFKISADTQLSVVWLQDNRERDRAVVTLRGGERWRTHTSTNILGQVGSWRVELRDGHEQTLASLAFLVN